MLNILINMTRFLNNLLLHIPTALAASLLLATIGHHINGFEGQTAPGNMNIAQNNKHPVQASNSVPDLTKGQLTLLVKQHIFGRVRNNAPEEKMEIVQQVTLPETKLKLNLSGVFSNDDKSAGHAIIGGREYRVGEEIDSQTSLHAVNSDGIVIKYNNQLEVLNLPNMDRSNRSGSSSNIAKKLPVKKNVASRKKN